MLERLTESTYLKKDMKLVLDGVEVSLEKLNEARVKKGSMVCIKERGNKVINFVTMIKNP